MYGTGLYLEQFFYNIFKSACKRAKIIVNINIDNFLYVFTHYNPIKLIKTVNLKLEI